MCTVYIYAVYAASVLLGLGAARVKPPGEPAVSVCRYMAGNSHNTAKE